jgi:hypothetical protein
MIPSSAPDSLNATVAVPFLSESGPPVRSLAWFAKWSRKANARKMDARCQDLPSIRKSQRYAGCTVHDMTVRQNQAVRGKDKARS